MDNLCSIVIERSQIPLITVFNAMITASAIFILVHTAAPCPRLLLSSCWSEFLPDTSVSPFYTNSWFLCERKVSSKVCFHSLSCYFIFFFFDSSFIGQPMDSCISFFLRSCRVQEFITILTLIYLSLSRALSSASFSTLSLVASIKEVVLANGLAYSLSNFSSFIFEFCMARLVLIEGSCTFCKD